MISPEFFQPFHLGYSKKNLTKTSTLIVKEVCISKMPETNIRVAEEIVWKSSRKYPDETSGALEAIIVVTPGGIPEETSRRIPSLKNFSNKFLRTEIGFKQTLLWMLGVITEMISSS